jgi:hypothetical protein
VQFMILLSALLASLTGLVAGERQPVRAQVEQSARAVAEQVEAKAGLVAERPPLAGPESSVPRLPRAPFAALLVVLLVGAFLSRKQSWLE